MLQEKLFFLKKKNHKSGFTLIETLVAISIFTMSVLALLVILGQGISSTSFAKNKIIATYLAQEGVEYVRNLRDAYMLDPVEGSDGWNNFKARVYENNLCEQGYGGCYIDTTDVQSSGSILDLIITQCAVTGVTATGCPQLKYDENTGEYGYTTGVDSGYSRKIRLSTDPYNLLPDEVRVDSIVSWTQGGTLHSVYFSDNLFNWIEQ